MPVAVAGNGFSKGKAMRGSVNHPCGDARLQGGFGEALPQTACTVLAAGILFAVLAGSGATPAQAGIRCDGPYQVMRDGGRLATPYCEDNYIAEVAREYGFKASAAKVRDNPNYRLELCRFIGQDIRVKSLCQRVLPGRRGPGL